MPGSIPGCGIYGPCYAKRTKTSIPISVRTLELLFFHDCKHQTITHARKKKNFFPDPELKKKVFSDKGCPGDPSPKPQPKKPTFLPMVKNTSRSIVVIPPSGDPTWMTASYVADGELDFLRSTYAVHSLQCKDWHGLGSEPSEEPLGKLYWTHSNDVQNILGSQLAPEAGGRCFLVGSSQKLTKSVFEDIFKLYNRVSGKRVTKRVEEKAPQKARSALVLYQLDFLESKKTDEKKSFSPMQKTEYRKEAALAWEKESQEVKDKYAAREAEDVKREQAELDAFQKQNPKEPKAARNPYQMFSAEHGRKPGTPLPEGVVPWKKMTEEQKAKYKVLAEEDKERYKLDLARYEANCAAAGKQPSSAKPTKHKSTESEEQSYVKRMETQLKAFNVPPPPQPTPAKRRKVTKKIAPAVGNEESDHE